MWGLVPLEVEPLFEQIAKQRECLGRGCEFHERAITELANALIREGNFADAELRLRKQLSIYPNGPEAGLARLLRACAYPAGRRVERAGNGRGEDASKR